MTEKDLVKKYKEIKTKICKLKESLKEYENSFLEIQGKIINELESKDAASTAKYDGIGRISIDKPTLYAYTKKENQELLFDYLRSEGREDLIKPSVHHKSLSSFAGEYTDAGKPLPDFIELSFKKVTRITA